MIKYLSVDIETGGLSPERDSIIEFGAVYDDLDNPLPLDQLPRYHCYFLPADGLQYHGSPFALSMHPKIFRRIADRENGYKYLNPNKFGYYFKQFLVTECGFVPENDRVTITAAGKNFGAFDLQFLDKQTDLNKHVNIRHRIIDPGSMYLKAGDEAVPGTQACLNRAGITDKVIAHTAIEDALDVIQLVRYKLIG